MPRPWAALRSRWSLVHRSAGALIRTAAIRCASVRPMPKLYKRRASMVSRTSLSCATFTWGKRSRSASVLVRSRREPRASSAMMNGRDHNVSLVKLRTHFVISRTGMVDPDGRIRENQFGCTLVLRGLRRGIFFNAGIVLPREASLRALFRSIRALRASRIKAARSFASSG